jgi:hypothetical protein
MTVDGKVNGSLESLVKDSDLVKKVERLEIEMQKLKDTEEIKCLNEQIWYSVWNNCAEHRDTTWTSSCTTKWSNCFPLMTTSAVIVTAEFGWEKRASTACLYVPPRYYLTQLISARILR